MSGTELDTDGTDTYHPEHPWEQVGHPLYLRPDDRTRSSWPPAVARAAGPAEEARWRALPEGAPGLTRPALFGPGVTYDVPTTTHTVATLAGPVASTARKDWD